MCFSLLKKAINFFWLWWKNNWGTKNFMVYFHSLGAPINCCILQPIFACWEDTIQQKSLEMSVINLVKRGYFSSSPKLHDVLTCIESQEVHTLVNEVWYWSPCLSSKRQHWCFHQLSGCCHCTSSAGRNFSLMRLLLDCVLHQQQMISNK